MTYKDRLNKEILKEVKKEYGENLPLSELLYSVKCGLEATTDERDDLEDQVSSLNSKICDLEEKRDFLKELLDNQEAGAEVQAKHKSRKEANLSSFV